MVYVVCSIPVLVLITYIIVAVKCYSELQKKQKEKGNGVENLKRSIRPVKNLEYYHVLKRNVKFP